MDTNANDSQDRLRLNQKSRREALKQIGASVLLVTLAPTLSGQTNLVQAKANRDPFIQLTAREAKTLEALGDTLLPGAAKAGIAYYIDRQLASDSPLLMLKYLDYPGTFLDFYRKGLAALESLSLRRCQRSFPDLTAAQQTELVGEIARANPDGWDGPPAPLFYFATRNDAVDVYYGTLQGFEKLGIPYMPHISPKQPW
jgi:hypothetical protein